MTAPTYEMRNARLVRERDSLVELLCAVGAPTPAVQVTRHDHAAVEWVSSNGRRRLSVTLRLCGADVSVLWRRFELGASYASSEASAAVHFAWLEGGA